MGRVDLDFFEHSRVGSDSVGPVRKSAPSTTMDILYRIIIFHLTHNYIKEDTVVCTPLYPVSEATGLQLVYIKHKLRCSLTHPILTHLTHLTARSILDPQMTAAGSGSILASREHRLAVSSCPGMRSK